VQSCDFCDSGVSRNQLARRARRSATWPLALLRPHRSIRTARIPPRSRAGELVRVPAGKPAAPDHDREVEATLAPDGSLTGSFTDRRRGEEFGPAAGMYHGGSKTDFTH